MTIDRVGVERVRPLSTPAASGWPGRWRGRSAAAISPRPSGTPPRHGSLDHRPPGLADREIVVEAIVESADEKVAVFEQIDKMCDSADRDLRVEHLVDPDHPAGRGHRSGPE